MKRNEILYIIGDYCSQYEIDITEAELAEAADIIGEKIADQLEYNERCGIHSVNVDILLDSYFEGWEEQNQ